MNRTPARGPGSALEVCFRLPLTGLDVRTYQPAAFAPHDWTVFSALGAHARESVDHHPVWATCIVDAVAVAMTHHGWRSGAAPPLNAWTETAAANRPRSDVWRHWLAQTLAQRPLRQGPVWFGDRHPSHAFQYAPPPEIASAIVDDIATLADRTDLDDTTFLVLAHYLWLEAHPLMDGNGRALRTLFVRLGASAFGSIARAAWLARFSGSGTSGVGASFSAFRSDRHQRAAAWWSGALARAIAVEASAVRVLLAARIRFLSEQEPARLWNWLLRPGVLRADQLCVALNASAHKVGGTFDRLVAAGWIVRDDHRQWRSALWLEAAAVLAQGLSSDTMALPPMAERPMPLM